MLGASAVREMGALTAKVRSSFGRGIRAAPPSPMSESGRMHHDRRLAPEQQTGIDGGVDLYLRDVASLHVTRFDQLASGLVQMVTLYDSTSSGAGGGSARIHYARQNVGEITNRGWEGKATLRAGAMDLIGTLSSVDSRVRAIATGYRGDLRPGDRMLGVPEHTGSISAGWSRRRWSTSWTVARASDWIDYDRLAIARHLEDWASGEAATGASLRDFWVRYPGTTRVRGTFNFDMPRGLKLTLTGENLGGQQRGEPDNMTVLPGRSITAALRANF
jgi:iron complex outermembrane receptor protein